MVYLVRHAVPKTVSCGCILSAHVQPQDGVLGTPVAVPAAQLVVRYAAHSRAQVRHNCRATAATIAQTFRSALELYITVFTVSKRKADLL